MFIWVASLQKLPTKEITSKYGGDSNLCPICHQFVENHLHALRDCPKAKCMWRKLVPMRNWGLFFAMGWKRWLRSNLVNHKEISDQTDWPEVFGVGCWALWKWRNCQVHDNTSTIPYEPGAEVLKYVYQYRKRWDKELDQYSPATMS